MIYLIIKSIFFNDFFPNIWFYHKLNVIRNSAILVKWSFCASEKHTRTSIHIFDTKFVNTDMSDISKNPRSLTHRYFYTQNFQVLKVKETLELFWCHTLGQCGRWQSPHGKTCHVYHRHGNTECHLIDKEERSATRGCCSFSVTHSAFFVMDKDWSLPSLFLFL